MPSKVVAIRGGLNLSKDRFSVREGELVECYNYEIDKDGVLASINGYRAFSGGCLYNASFTMLATNSSGDASWGQFGPGFTTVGGDVFTTAGYAASVLAINSGPSGIVGGIVGRLPFSGERINGGTGVLQDTTLDFVATAPTAVLAHRAMTYDIGKAWTAIGDINTPTFGYNTAPGTADVIYCTSPLGHPPGMFYWKDRLHVVCDIAAFRLVAGEVVVTVGSTVYLYHASLGSGGPYTVERVIITEGSWETNDAAGYVWLLGTTFPAIKVVDSGSTTNFDLRSAAGGAGTLYATVSAQVDPGGALLVKETGPYITGPAAAWSRIDLGYEVQFNSGDNAFVVVNRLALDDRLTAPQATDYKNPGTATSTYWGSPNNAKLDDATATTITPGVTGPNSEPLTVTNYGFEIPTYATITGIEVIIDRNAAAANSIRDYVVSLVVGDSQVSLNRATYSNWAFLAYEKITYGSPTDLWGMQLSPEMVNSSAFGVKLLIDAVSSGVQARVDVIQVRVHYKPYAAAVYFYDLATTTDLGIADVVWYYKEKGDWTTNDAEGVLTLYNVRSIVTQSITGIARVGSIATATKVAHGYSSGDQVTIAGATQTDYNGTFTIFNVAANTFDYNVQNSPATPATGTITATAIGAVMTDPSETIKTGLRMYSGPNATGTLYATTAGTCERVYLPSSAQCAGQVSQYEFEIGNFYGSTTFEQVFGVNGAGPAFSYDGKYAIRIRTGVEFNMEKPRHVAKHGPQLALGYAFGDVAFSDVGAPESYAVVSGGSSPVSEDPDFLGGAVSVNIADRVYSLVSIAEQSLAVFCKDSMVRVSGSSGTFTTQVVRAESGVIEYSVKDLGGLLLYTDFRGPGILRPSDIFGQLIPTYIGAPVSSWLTPRLLQSGNSSVTISGFVRAETVKSKNQYRLFFRDRYVLTMTLVGQDFTPQFSMQQWDHDVRASCSGAHSNGTEMSFFSTSGTLSYPAGTNYVYQSDVGTTFDNAAIVHRALIMVSNTDGPQQFKRYSDCALHASAFGFMSLGARAFVDYARSEALSTYQALTLGDNGTVTELELTTPSNYVQSVTFGAKGFAMLLQVEKNGGFDYAGAAAASDYKYLMPHSLNAVTIHYEPMAPLRGGR